MDIFKNIENGVLPSDEEFFYILQNDIKDENPKILEYIKILQNSYQISSIEEKILLNKVLFVLEKLSNNPKSIENFINRAFTLHIHQVSDDYEQFITKFLELVDENELFESISNIIDNISDYNSIDFRSFFNWCLHKVWNISKFNNSPLFHSLYDKLKILLFKLRDNNRIADMMYLEFFIYHIMGNSFQKMEEWREFNENITKETIKVYKQLIPQLSIPKNTKKSKKKIAFIKDRIVKNSPYMVEYSLFKTLMENEEFRNNYELIVYTFNLFEKSSDSQREIMELEKIGIKVKRVVDSFREDGYYNNHLDKAITLRQAIIDDDIDIMIGGGVYSFMNFLYVTRTAPLQIYYSHGNCAYDVPNIDKRISHFNQECQEFEWNIIKVPLAEDFLVGTEDEKTVGEIIKKDYQEKFGEDVVILGTIGRLIKIDSDEYIKTIAKIMEENTNTIYLACGLGNEESIKEKLKKYNIDEKRFIFTGMVKAHVYGWVIDVWPDSFPLRGGQSKAEFMSKGGILIDYAKYYYGDAYKNILSFKEKFNLNNIDYPIATTLEEYILFVNKAIQDDKYRKEIGMIQKEHVLKQVNTNFIEILEQK